MRFSVLVPIYNCTATLEACVSSVLTQDFTDWELVLVDDGSTDESGALCDGYVSAHPEKVRCVHQVNGGLIAARRTGVREANGDYCLFLDGDDAFQPGSFASIDQCLTLTGADMVLFPYADWYPETGMEISASPVFRDGAVFLGPEKEAVYRELIRSWRLNNLCTKAIRTTLLQRDNTDYAAFGKNPNTEDLLQTLYPVTHADKIAYLASPLYRYRRRADSISAKALPGQIRDQLNTPVMDMLRAYMTRWGMDDGESLNAFHSRKLYGMTTLFWQHWRAARTKEARKEVLDYPWADHLSPEDTAFLNGDAVSRRQKEQVQAILEKNETKLALLSTLGKLSMRLRHGK